MESVNRRAFLRGTLACAAGVAASSSRAGMAAGAPPALSTIELAPHLWLVRGGGGNVVVKHTSEGVLLVDGGSPERSGDVLRLVHDRTGGAGVKVLFNTHWHWDQTGSNRSLGPQGIRIIAHENTRLWLGTEIDSKWEHRLYPPLPEKARPNETFYTQGTLSFGGERIDYGYLPQAHTDGDIYVFLRDANVLVAGDVAARGAYPILDYSTNGWIGGMANAAQTLLDLAGADTRIVPGSGEVLTRSDLVEEHAMLTTLKQRLSKLLAQGMSAQDMIAAAPTREFDTRWGDPKLFIANAWPGLVARSRELGVSIV
jgi:glyoxylase-like metal-dependent hydrolase (beta-lactamase superfamily II)